MFKILVASKVQKTIGDLPADIKERVFDAFGELAALGLQSSNIRKLKLPLEGYRKRVGKHRVFFDIKDSVILIQKVSKRDESYR